MLLLLALLACGLTADLTSGVTPSTRDLERLCRIAEELDERDMLPDARLKRIGERIAGEHLDTLIEAWRTLQEAPPEVRRELYREMLEQAGMPDFRCAPLEEAVVGRARRPRPGW